MASNELFLDKQVARLRDRVRELPVDYASHRARLAVVNPSILTDIRRVASAREESTITLTANLFDDVILNVHASRVEDPNPWNTFRGYVEGADESSVVMTEEDGSLTLDIWVDDAEYQVRDIEEDVYLVEQVNLSAPVECSAEATTADERFDASADDEREEELEEESRETSLITVTVLVLYTPGAIRQAGSERNMLRDIRMMVGNLNGALSRSLVGTGAAVQVMAADRRSYDDSHLSANNCTAKSQLARDRDVKRWRNNVSADLVSVIRATAQTSCAHCLTTTAGNSGAAFSAVKYEQAIQRHSFSHELGHNFGCPHDRRNADCWGINKVRTDPYWGYHWAHSNGHHYGTLMSYPGERILNFSNPNVRHLGEPTGTSDNFNALAIAKTAAKIAAYR